LNAALAIAILHLISQVDLPSFVKMLFKYLKDSTFSSIYIVCSRACVGVLLPKVTRTYHNVTLYFQCLSCFIPKTRSEKCELDTNFEISGEDKCESAETVIPATLPNLTLEWVEKLRHDFCLGSRFLGGIRWLKRFQWPRGLRRRSTAARMLWLWVRITPEAWTSALVSVVCCQVEVSVGLITRPEDSYRVWCVWVWTWSLDNEALAHWGLLCHGKEGWPMFFEKY
jgi:hypothetical protein